MGGNYIDRQELQALNDMKSKYGDLLAEVENLKTKNKFLENQLAEEKNQTIKLQSMLNKQKQHEFERKVIEDKFESKKHQVNNTEVEFDNSNVHTILKWED